MTRRIALAILLTVWAMLVAGGAVAYATTRAVLLADLDASLVRRARALPDLSQMREAAERIEESAGDRYVIESHINRTLGRLPEPGSRAPMPALIGARLARLGDGARVRSLTLRFTPASPAPADPVTVVYSGSAEHFYAALDRLALALIVFGAAAGAAAACVAVGVSRAALRPLHGIADAIGAINERQLDRRIDPAALPAELRPVAGRLNEMLARLQVAFAQRKQFLADASHELRTPVAALVTTLEVTLRRPREAAELTAALRTCLSDARMLRQLVQTLLEHARADGAARGEPPHRFDALALLNQCADVADGLALARNVTIRRILPASLEIVSEPQRLRGIAINLLGNAVEYNRPDGTVELCAVADGADLELTVTDTGPGIAPEHIAHVFEPFYRASPERGANHSTDGSERQHLGLGLFLVDSHVKALGATVRVESTQGAGTTMRVRIPQVISEAAAVVPAALEASAV